MESKNFLVFSFLLIFFIFAPFPVSAEDKNTPGGMIPKLPKTQNDPVLSDGRVYPFWGPPCQRYTYSVIYRDKEGRKPEYMKIYFNGKMIDMDPTSPEASLGKKDYQNGVRYEYKYVPNKVGSNFYYFEASNGLGKTRASIIDSPDNGPVLFTSPFDKNEIAVIDKQSGKKILEFSTGKEWIGGIALSDDGKYLAAKTSKHIYLFDTAKPAKPIWQFNCEQCQIGDDVKGGIDISGDGSRIIAAFGDRIVLFDKSNNKPIWMYSGGNSYNVAISKDGEYMAAATAGDESNINSNLIILWNEKSEKPLWQYHAAGNFHDVSLSDDGRFVAGSTGCPDKRFYLFSKDSNNPLIKSEQLTRDSPIHRAKISGDGLSAAVGSESDGGAVFLFNKNSKNPVWKFPTPQGSSVRALNFTPNGQYIGAATFGGNAYIFNKDKNVPIAEWKVDASLGGVDISDDGSFLAAGGTDKKLYIFDKNAKSKTEIPFNEYLEEVDISANGKYIAAGTGGSVYFFETYISQDKGKTFDCSSVIEPQPETQMQQEGGLGIVERKTGLWERMVSFIQRVLKLKPEPSKQSQPFPEKPSGNAVCGNDFCEPNFGETKENCPKDCSAGD
ncbi:hypothetical protein HYU89_04330 [Candidatus Collierbacteria bacterium]|nr:hypothetical protein [Candidatus Collierbacteria bacterium]